MNLTCSTRAIKYLMFIFNFFFVITGIALIAVGATIKSNYKQYETFLDDKYFSLPNLLIATGVLIFFISFLGCYGALKESWIILLAFSVLLGIIFIFEFSAGIAGYVLRDKTSDYLETTFYESMAHYNSSASIAKMWDVIQYEFECCGVVSPDDWKTFTTNDDLPISCCPNKFGTIGEFHCNNIKTTSVAPSSATTPAPTATPGPTATPSPTTKSPPASSTTYVPTTETTALTPHKHGTSLADNQFRRKRFADGGIETPTVAPISTTEPYQQGCESAFGDYVKSHAVDIGAVGFALAVIQIAGIVFSCYLARQLKNQYYST